MSGVPTVTDIQRMLSPYRYSASVEYAEGMRAYIELLLRWNQKVALTTVTDPREIVRFHFGESLLGMEVAGVRNGRLADLGSGAGFPGAPIAMARPELSVVLIESNGKKAAFLGEVRRQLNLRNVEIQRQRAEQVPSDADFDFVIARAVGEHEKWLEWSSRTLTPKGRVALWVNSEDADAICQLRRWRWIEQTKIPETEDRFVIVGERNP